MDLTIKKIIKALPFVLISQKPAGTADSGF